jgi:K+-sensing histidine kinase KdpD
VITVSDRQQARGAERGGGGGSPEPNSSTRGSFLGFVAHEMRNPLSTALWSAELLARLAPEDRAGPRGEKLSNMCLRALQRLRLLLEDHFLAERLDVDGIPFKVEAVGVREILDQLAGKNGVAVSLVVDEALAVEADRGLLERALEALLAAASQGKTPVRVEASRSNEGAAVRFRGAAPAAEALGVPHKGTPSDPTGRALSLYMATKVVRALGGALTSSGEEYLLTLPLAPAAAPEAP